MGKYICIEGLSLRFHNGLTHILAFRDNQEKLNHKAIRQDIFIIIVFLTCICTKNQKCTTIKGQGHSPRLVRELGHFEMS